MKNLPFTLATNRRLDRWVRIGTDGTHCQGPVRVRDLPFTPERVRVAIERAA